MRQVDMSEIKPLMGIVAPLVDKVGYGSPVKTGSDYKFEWPKDEVMDAQVTLTDGISDSDTTMVAATDLTANDVNKLQVGQVIQFENEQIRVTINDGTTVTFTAVPVGTILPIVARRINATLTTATVLVGLRQV